MKASNIEIYFRVCCECNFVFFVSYICCGVGGIWAHNYLIRHSVSGILISFSWACCKYNQFVRAAVYYCGWVGVWWVVFCWCHRTRVRNKSQSLYLVLCIALSANDDAASVYKSEGDVALRPRKFIYLMNKSVSRKHLKLFNI